MLNYNQRVTCLCTDLGICTGVRQVPRAASCVTSWTHDGVGVTDFMTVRTPRHHDLEIIGSQLKSDYSICIRSVICLYTSTLSCKYTHMSGLVLKKARPYKNTTIPIIAAGTSIRVYQPSHR